MSDIKYHFSKARAEAALVKEQTLEVRSQQGGVVIASVIKAGKVVGSVAYPLHTHPILFACEVMTQATIS